MRSLLLVPMDRPDALAKAFAAQPSAVLLDIGGSEAGDRAAARRAVATLLVEACASVERPRLLVRIAALSSGLVDGDLDAVMDRAPDAVILPGTVGARDVEHLGAKLAVREAERAMVPETVGILAIAGDSALGILALPTLPGAGPRLRALAFDGAAFGRDSRSAPARTARGSLVLAAMAAGVPAIDLGGGAIAGNLARACAAARRDGFTARLARRPEDVATIEACFGA